MTWDSQEIADVFADLSLGETGGVDPLTAAALYHTERWEDYEEQRRMERERNAAFHRHELDRWRRANANRKRKRRGLHLSNTERVMYAEMTSAGDMTPEDVARETGCSVATAERLGQLVIEWEGAA